MKKWLNHRDWIAQQFKEKYLKSHHRNVLIHSSIIEGMLVNESGMGTFDSANKFLLCSKRISSAEFCMFNKIRQIRNKITHEIFKKKGFSQKDIDELLKALMKQMLEAYKTSDFLSVNLFKKYKAPPHLTQCIKNKKDPELIESLFLFHSLNLVRNLPNMNLL